MNFIWHSQVFYKPEYRTKGYRYIIENQKNEGHEEYPPKGYYDIQRIAKLTQVVFCIMSILHLKDGNQGVTLHVNRLQIKP